MKLMCAFDIYMQRSQGAWHVFFMFDLYFCYVSIWASTATLEVRKSVSTVSERIIVALVSIC